MITITTMDWKNNCEFNACGIWQLLSSSLSPGTVCTRSQASLPNTNQLGVKEKYTNGKRPKTQSL